MVEGGQRRGDGADGFIIRDALMSVRCIKRGEQKVENGDHENMKRCGGMCVSAWGERETDGRQEVGVYIEGGLTII